MCFGCWRASLDANRGFDMAAPRLSYLPRARAVTRSSKAAHADADMFAADMFAKCSSLQPKTLMVQSECSYEGLAYTCMHRKDQGADVGSGGLLDCLDDDSADVCRSPSNSLCVSKLKPSAGPSFALFPVCLAPVFLTSRLFCWSHF